jgi:ferric-dicitrate binding protein FerR (iron transport regulator)
MYRVIRVTAIAFAMMSVWLMVAAAQENVGEISKINGIAKLERSGKVLEVANAMPVAIGDTIRTPPNAQVSVTFKDGSMVELGESTSFTIDQYEIVGSRRSKGFLELHGGHLRSLVKIASGEPNFEVHTPNAVASVRGTEFETAFIDGRPCPEDRSCLRYTTVDVFKGIVVVSNPSNSAPPLEVGEGYATTVACESAATSPAPVGVQELGAPGYH